VYFSGLNEEAKRAVEEVYSGKSVGYTLDLNLAEFLYKEIRGLRRRKASPFRAGMDSPLIFKHFFFLNFFNG
jgi:predicted nucleic acid-binding protein